MKMAIVCVTGSSGQELAANLAREWRERIKTEVRPEYQTTETVVKEALSIIRSQIKVIEDKRSSFQEKRNDVTAIFTASSKTTTIFSESSSRDWKRWKHRAPKTTSRSSPIAEQPPAQGMARSRAASRTVPLLHPARHRKRRPIHPGRHVPWPKWRQPQRPKRRLAAPPQAQQDPSASPSKEWKERTAKRIRARVDLTEQALNNMKTKKCKLTSPTLTKKVDVDGRDVEGREYIFAYHMVEHPPLARGWYVLRCYDGDESCNPKASPCCVFWTNPSEIRSSTGLSPAMQHFNNRDCKARQGHDPGKGYGKTDEIVRSHGHRVGFMVFSPIMGSYVDEAWVKQANAKLAERLSGDKRNDTR
ncbi:hypothetical protein B0T22DRAFT_519095 [Podospora appendiculata]|uniref:Uncharacterized protein n=1 Tax=Podospora appendiculata TaxID=314037 RepID=A0AAE1C8R8_9PEZI|nr:hypothetical protein B0T22DRAFT_519095 [Podospora appendiculata]